MWVVGDLHGALWGVSAFHVLPTASVLGGTLHPSERSCSEFALSFGVCYKPRAHLQIDVREISGELRSGVRFRIYVIMSFATHSFGYKGKS